jgi:hypothetical protein
MLANLAIMHGFEGSLDFLHHAFFKEGGGTCFAGWGGGRSKGRACACDTLAVAFVYLFISTMQMQVASGHVHVTRHTPSEV